MDDDLAEFIALRTLVEELREKLILSTNQRDFVGQYMLKAYHLGLQGVPKLRIVDGKG